MNGFVPVLSSLVSAQNENAGGRPAQATSFVPLYLKIKVIQIRTCSMPVM